MAFLPAWWNGADGAELPGRIPFERYRSLTQASFFTTPTMSVIPFSFQPGDFLMRRRDLYIASMSRTPEGDTVTLRSVADPTFSMTIRFKHAKVTPPEK